MTSKPNRTEKIPLGNHNDSRLTQNIYFKPKTKISKNVLKQSCNPRTGTSALQVQSLKHNDKKPVVVRRKLTAY